MEGCDEYCATLYEVIDLNKECVEIWKKIPELKKISDTEASYVVFSSVSFIQLNDKMWMLSFVSEERKVNFFPDFQNCFHGFKNPLKTNLPVFTYNDMSDDLEIYKMLIPKEGLQLVCSLKGCLNRVQSKLSEVQKTLDRDAQLSKSILETFGLHDSQHTFWVRKEDEDLNKVSISFDLKIKMKPLWKL